ncbi:MAG: hypothetical protein LBF41_03450, partial [Deltaproteobacteria bacterium]|nr:hypothetical protein [Deltaproteobacteria bacterium]
MTVHTLAGPLKAGMISLAALTLLIFSSASLMAHGVVWEESQKRAYGVEFAYDDGSVMSFVDVKVYGPDDEKNFAQAGRTNEAGYFAFIPVTDGKYLVVADDGRSE